MKEIIITSSVLILCIMLIRIIFKGKISSRLQYALWLLVALRLMIPASAQIYMAIGSIEEFRIMDLTRMLETKIGDVTEQLEKPVTSAPFTMSLNVNNALAERAAEVMLGEELNLPASEDGPTAVFVAGKVGIIWLDVLRGIWIGGMVIVALWMLITNMLFRHKLHKGRKEFILPELEHEDLQQENEAYQSAGKMFNKPMCKMRIYTIEGLVSPCLYGLPFREAIYLTPDIAEDQDRMRHVLAHEMCHKKHGDSFWSILRSVLLIIYWMNPLVWVAAVLSKRDCELACDEEALLMLGEEERISYGETLLSIITRKGRLSDIACTATTMTGSGKSVKERIKYIAEKPRVLGATVAAVLVLVLVISVLVFTKNPLFHGNTWEGETTLTAGDMQITLPETIAGISGYETDQDGDIVIYQVASGKEVGRFCEVSYGEAVMLIEQGREVIPIGDYGRNIYLKQYMSSLYPNETVTHTYTPNESVTESVINSYEPSDNGAGMLYHEDRYEGTDEPNAGVLGTDINDDTTYIIENGFDSHDGPEQSVPGSHYNWMLSKDWEFIPLSETELELDEEILGEEIKQKEEAIKKIEEEIKRKAEQEAERELQEQERMLQELIAQREEEIALLEQLLQAERERMANGALATEHMYSYENVGVSGTDINDDTFTYIIDDDGAPATLATEESIDYSPEEITAEESVDYLPNEELIVTYTPGNTTAKCYIYVKGDYSGVKTQYLEELSYIDSILKTVVNQVIVVDSD